MLYALVSTCIFTLQLFTAMYSRVTEMFKICSLAKNIIISDDGDACSEEKFSTSQKLFCLLHLPEFVWGLLLHIFEKCPTFSQACFFSKRWTGSTRMWLTSTPSAHIVALIS